MGCEFQWVPYDEEEIAKIEAAIAAGKSLVQLPELDLYLNLRMMQQVWTRSPYLYPACILSA